MLDNLMLVRQHYIQFKKIPTIKNPGKKKLARWFSGQLFKMRGKTDEIYTTIARYAPELVNHMDHLLQRREIQHRYSIHERCDQLKVFYHQYKRLPNPLADNQDEVQLGVWFKNMLARKLKIHGDGYYNMLVSLHIPEITKRITNLLNLRQQRQQRGIKVSINRPQRLAHFFATNENRMPRMKSTDKIEVDLAKWISSQVSRVKAKNDAMYIKLKAFNNKALVDRVDRLLHKRVFNYELELQSFYAQKKILPYKLSNDYVERKLGAWITIQIARMKKKNDSVYTTMTNLNIPSLVLYMNTTLAARR